MNRKTYIIASILLTITIPVASLGSIEDHNINPDAIPAPLTEEKEQANTPIAEGRGQLLYENHCIECHDSIAHQRQFKKAHSVKDIRQWVQHWAIHLKLDWNTKDVDTVSEYLNKQFYHFAVEE